MAEISPGKADNGDLSKKQIVFYLLIGLATIAYLARDFWWPTSDGLASLRGNVGKNACNRLNGAYAGRILGVTRDPVNRTDTIVYQVQRPESRATYAPADNITITTGKCPDGQP
jgi:hypothetical protein